MSATAQEMALIVRARNMAKTELRSVGSDLDALERKTGRMGQAFGTAAKVAKVAMVAIGVAVVAGLAAGVGAWVGFDQKMTESLAIMGPAAQEWRDEMETAAREVAKTTTFSAEEAAESYFFLASAGMSAEQSIAALPAVAAFAQAGMFDMALATDLATDAQSALGLVSDDAAKNLENMTRVTDVLVGANTLANASVQQFSEAITNKAGAAMRAVGMDIEEGTAVLAAFADQGLKGASAGTALHIVLRDLQTAALKNVDEFSELGVSVFDSQGEMRNMADVVGDLEGLLDGMSDAQRKTTLAQLGFTDKSMGFINQLLGTSDAIREYEGALREAGGVTQEIADNQLQSLSAQWDLFKSKIIDVFIGLGKQLSPALNKIMEVLGDFAENVLPRVVEKLQEWGAIVMEVGRAIFEHLVAAVQAVISWWQDLSPEMQDAIRFGGILAGVFIALAAAVGLLTTALGILASPILLVIAAIVAIGAGLKLAYDKFETFRNIVDAVIKWFREDALETFEKAWAAIVSAVETAWAAIKLAFVTVSEFLQDLWNSWGEEILAMAQVAWELIVTSIETAWAFIKDVFETSVEIIKFIWENWGETLLSLARTTWEFITGVIEGAWDLIKGIFQTATAILKGDWEGLWNGLKDVASAAWGLVTIWFGTAIAVFKAIWEAAWTGVSIFFKGIWTGLTFAASAAWSVFIGFWNRVWQIFKSGWDLVWGTLSDAVSTAFGGVVGVVGGILQSVVNIFNTAVNAIKDTINKLISAYNAIPIAPDIPLIGSGGGKKNITIPHMARGGKTIVGGLSLVGENGPELLNMNRGATVTPLPTNSNSGSLGSPTEVHLHIHGVDLSDSRAAIEKIREGIRQLDLEAS